MSDTQPIRLAKMMRWMAGIGPPLRCCICGRFIPWVDFTRSNRAVSRFAPTDPMAYEPNEDVEHFCCDHAHEYVLIPELKRRLKEKYQ